MMGYYIKPEHLTFLDECKRVFSENGRRVTHQSEDGSFIALRYGADRDCIQIFELGNEVAFFAQQIEPYPSFRNEVFYFARDMENQLKVNEHKGGWGKEHHEFLIKQLNNNLVDLFTELKNTDKDKYEITIRCTNIANFAMMIADNEGKHL